MEIVAERDLEERYKQFLAIRMPAEAAADAIKSRSSSYVRWCSRDVVYWGVCASVTIACSLNIVGMVLNPSWWSVALAILGISAGAAFFHDVTATRYRYKAAIAMSVGWSTRECFHTFVEDEYRFIIAEYQSHIANHQSLTDDFNSFVPELIASDPEKLRAEIIAKRGADVDPETLAGAILAAIESSRSRSKRRGRPFGSRYIGDSGEIVQAVAELEREMGKSPTQAETAQRLGVSTDTLRRTLRAYELKWPIQTDENHAA